MQCYGKELDRCFSITARTTTPFKMQQVCSIIKILALLTVLNALIAANQDSEVEAIFFLDLLCASRIEALEKQVSQLVALSRGNGRTTSSSTQSLLDG